MKLVDILARKIIWPEGLECLSQLQHNGSIINGKGFDGRVWAWLEIAEDTPPAGVIVTKAEWQAAVDALKAEVHPTESMALHHQEVGRITRQWSGEGPPPTGTVCEVSAYNGAWAKAEIKFIGDEHCVYKYCLQDGRTAEQLYEISMRLTAIRFRPIRTPEQIAADERLHEVRNALSAIHAGQQQFLNDLFRGNIVAATVEAMIDAGYRKFEIVDN